MYLGCTCLLPAFLGVSNIFYAQPTADIYASHCDNHLFYKNHTFLFKKPWSEVRRDELTSRFFNSTVFFWYNSGVGGICMAIFLNPDNANFNEAVHSKIYVDKTGLIEYTNSVLSTTAKFICNSRPRRFGKSMTADMLCAYYSKGCDSRELFQPYTISSCSTFEKYINQYDVIHIDVPMV